MNYCEQINQYLEIALDFHFVFLQTYRMSFSKVKTNKYDLWTNNNKLERFETCFD